MTVRGLAVGVLSVLALAVTNSAIAQTTAEIAASPSTSGLPIPRFVSLKSDRVNLRQGPGTDYPTAWIFRRAGLPVEVIKEFEGWRQIRDSEGTTGWVLGSMLSGRRTAILRPWDVKSGQTTSTALRDDDREGARTIAFAEPGVLASIISCDGAWCRLSIGEVRGYIGQKTLWGVYQGEIVK
jgi:SH3-like domain-containing protein